MDITSIGPFRTAKIIWQSPQRTHALTIIAKATFRLLPGTSALAPMQEAILDRDKAWDGGSPQSVYAPSDRVPYKPRADVVVVGHAYAPANQLARSVTTRLFVGEVDKSIEVFCDRVMRLADGQVLEGPRFAHMPLRWERAAGGPSSTNPVGMRFDAPPDMYGVIPIPNLQPPGMSISKRSDVFAPICYAPISPLWPVRTQRLKRLSKPLLEGGWENEPLPADMDAMFFQAAFVDQTTREIKPNETIVLENLHPQHARLVTTLPGVHPRAVVERATGEREEITLIGDTLWIDTDRGIGCVVWRGRMGLRHPTEAGKITLWADGPLAVEAKERSAKPQIGETFRMDPTKVPKEPALPFSPGLGALGTVGDPKPQMFSQGNSPLTEPAARIEEPSAQLKVKLDGGTIKLVGTERFEPALPFGPKEEPPAPLAVVLPPEEPPAPQNASFFVEPPPMIGPLATPEMFGKPQETPVKEVAPEPEPVKEPEPIPVEEPKKRNPEEFPLERCAALTASMARRKSEKDAILKKNELTADEWGAIEKHWDEAIRKETKRGKRTLLDRFDRAYVDQIEAERGPITVEEYAKLTVGGERGTLDEVSQELDLPRGALMRVDRIWMRRLVTNQALASKLSQLMEAVQ